MYGPPKPRRPITSDLRQEPGALAAHAGICAGGSGVTRPPTATIPTAMPKAGEGPQLDICWIAWQMRQWEIVPSVPGSMLDS